MKTARGGNHRERDTKAIRSTALIGSADAGGGRQPAENSLSRKNQSISQKEKKEKRN